VQDIIVVFHNSVASTTWWLLFRPFNVFLVCVF